jgi:hypothetical protein
MNPIDGLVDHYKYQGYSREKAVQKVKKEVEN